MEPASTRLEEDPGPTVPTKQNYALELRHIGRLFKNKAWEVFTYMYLHYNV